MERRAPQDDGLLRVEVRRATRADAELLFAWANDPATRAASFHQDLIEWSTHLAWLDRRLSSPGSRLFIGMLEGQPVGQVRFDREPEGDAEVSIAVAPGARGRGVGRALLEAGIAAVAFEGFGRTAVARMRTDNPASMALFRAARFELVGESVCAGAPCLVFRRDFRHQVGAS